jgi:phosphoribosylformylglycinamidine synthase
MAFAGGYGARIRLDDVPQQLSLQRNQPERVSALLFAESNSRFVCEVPQARRDEFEKIMAGLPMAWIGEVTAAPQLIIGCDGLTHIDTSVAGLKEVWQRTLRL